MIKGVAHIAFTVMDMEKSLHFYCDVLGLKKAFEVRHDNGDPWIINIRIAEGQYFELLYGGTENYQFFHEKAGYSHMCLEVEDIYELAERLRQNGVKLDIEPRKGKDLNYQCWACDPDGHRIEFMQFDPESPQKKGSW